MQVIEELDNGKKGTSEASRNARQVSRFSNELIEAQGTDKIASGLVLERPNGLQLRGAQSIGRLRFQFGALETRKRGGDKADNDIKIGRASCRERVYQYVLISVVDVSLKKK